MTREREARTISPALMAYFRSKETQSRYLKKYKNIQPIEQDEAEGYFVFTAVERAKGTPLRVDIFLSENGTPQFSRFVEPYLSTGSKITATHYQDIETTVTAQGWNSPRDDFKGYALEVQAYARRLGISMKWEFGHHPSGQQEHLKQVTVIMPHMSGQRAVLLMPNYTLFNEELQLGEKIFDSSGIKVEETVSGETVTETITRKGQDVDIISEAKRQINNSELIPILRVNDRSWVDIFQRDRLPVQVRLSIPREPSKAEK